MGMTDEELIKQLREVTGGKLFFTNTPNHLRLTAADRIEELLRDMVRAKECLRNRIHFYECDCGECDRIRITLEVIKGET